MPSEVSHGNVHVLNYDISWMNSVFRSRARAEALLSPERESGNLTTRDYDTAIQFLPGTHHYYPIIGIAVGSAIGLAFRFRYPRLSPLKQMYLLLGSVTTGHISGKARQLYAHFDYLHDIENPDGYKRAIENVRKEIGLPIQKGLVIERSYQISPNDASQSEHGLQLTLPSESSPPRDSSLTERSQSKWDQIRAANSRTAQNSAWDALRQRHEKVGVKQEQDDDRWNTSEG